MHYKIFLCVLLFPVSLSAQNGELSLTLEQSASLMNKGSRTLQMADKAVYGAQNETYMSRSAEKWVRGLCFNELGVCG